MDLYLEKIRSLGCKNVKKVQLAYILYQQLCETKLLWDIECYYNETLDLIYIKAKNAKNSEFEIFVPQSTSDVISLEDVSIIQQAVESKKITLAIMESDSTTVYYEFSEGFQNLSSETEVMKVNHFSKPVGREKEYSKIHKLFLETNSCNETLS